MSQPLTSEQEQAAARRAEPLLLSAGAGSGKTSVLVERFVRAVLQDAIAPAQILAITFTDRAAGELRERVRTRLLELGERQAARDTEAAFVSTFHGFCARLLRAHALLAGLDPDFAVLAEGIAGSLRERALRSALGRLLAAGEPGLLDVVAAYRVDDVSPMLLGAYASLRSRGMRVPRLPIPPEPQPDELSRDARAALIVLDRLLVAFAEDYEALKRARAAVDFDDLELLAAELLRREPRVARAWSERFQLLMVDEFQDTNHRQMAILRSLQRQNLFTVGDELQSIYGFRHAQVELFRQRRSELAGAGRSLTLTRNFRSSAPVLDFVNALFAGRMATSFTPLLAGREPAAGPDAGDPAVELLLSSTTGWEDPELAGALGHGLPPSATWRHAEAHALAARVHELIDSGEAQAGDVVLLLRARGDIEVYERALQLRGLRTIAMVGSFWERLHTRDVLCYLGALANPLHESALYEALASPFAGVSTEGLALLAEASRAHAGGVWRTMRELAPAPARGCPLERLAAQDRARLLRFGELLAGERDGAAHRSIAQLIERALDATGYRGYVLSLDWGERRLANLNKLLRLARSFEESEGRDLRGFLEHAARMQEDTSQAEPDAPVDSVEPDAIRLMSIHAAKGLEFGVVCVADLGRGPGGHPPRLLVDEGRVGLSLLRLDGARAVPALDYQQLLAERRAAEAEEEDRVLYVAMTRARERLILSGATDLSLPAERERSPSALWLARAIAGSLALPLDEGPEQVDVRMALGEGEGESGGSATVRCRFTSPRTAAQLLPPAAAAASGAAAGAVAAAASEAAAASARLAGPATGTPVPRLVPAAGEAQTGAGGGPPQRGGPPRQGGAPRRGQAPAEQSGAVSFTSLSLLERCGYRYYLERVLGLAEDRSAAAARRPGRGLDGRQRGTLVHALLESLDFGAGRAPDAGAVLRAARGLGMHAGRAEASEISGLLGAALASGTASRVAAAGALRREVPFAFALEPGGPVVGGVIDLMASEHDGGVLVVDHKTDRVGAHEDLEQHVQLEYGLQRLVYALSVLSTGAPEVRVVHWFLARPQDPVQASFEQKGMQELRRQLRERVRAAHAGGYAVSPNPHRGLCLTCPGRSGLCSWSEVHTLREQPTGGDGQPVQLTLAP